MNHLILIEIRIFVLSNKFLKSISFTKIHLLHSQSATKRIQPQGIPVAQAKDCVSFREGIDFGYHTQTHRVCIIWRAYLLLAQVEKIHYVCMCVHSAFHKHTAHLFILYEYIHSILCTYFYYLSLSLSLLMYMCLHVWVNKCSRRMKNERKIKNNRIMQYRKWDVDRNCSLNSE